MVPYKNRYLFDYEIAELGAFLDLRSRVLDARAHDYEIFFKARRNAEREEVGTLISCARSKNAIS